MTTDEWRSSVDRRLVNLEKQGDDHARGIAELQVQAGAEQVRLESVASDVREIKDGQKWLTRLVVGAVIMAVVGYALSGGFALEGAPSVP